jgi:hypothetical protein
MAVKTEINAACLFSYGEVDFEGKKIILYSILYEQVRIYPEA